MKYDFLVTRCTFKGVRNTMKKGGKESDLGQEGEEGSTSARGLLQGPCKNPATYPDALRRQADGPSSWSKGLSQEGKAWCEL